MFCIGNVLPRIFQHYVEVLIQVPALCAGLDSGTSIMCRSWFRDQRYVQVLIQVPALCAGLDPGTSIMCRSWFRYQHYVQVLIQVPALCAGLDSGTNVMCRSWSSIMCRYMCSSEVPTLVICTDLRNYRYGQTWGPNTNVYRLEVLTIWTGTRYQIMCKLEVTLLCTGSR